LRTLTFYTKSFTKINWPKKFKNISHVIVVGAYSFDSYQEQPSHVFLNMLKKRTTRQFKFYALSFNHNFKQNILVKHGRYREGSEIGLLEMDNQSDIHNIIMNDVYKYDETIQKELLDFETGKIF